MLQKGRPLKVKFAVKFFCHICKALDKISLMCHVSPQMASLTFSLVEWLAFFLSRFLVSLDMDGSGLGYLSYQSSMKCT